MNMSINFKYILVLLFLSLIVSKMCCSLKKKNMIYESFTSYNDYYQTINPKLAGSIDIHSTDQDNANLNQLLATQLIKYNEIIQTPELAGSIDIDPEMVNEKCPSIKEDEIKVDSNKNTKYERYLETPSDYMRYEVILPKEYQSDNVKYTDRREEITDRVEGGRRIQDAGTDDVEERSKLGRIIYPENDCQGEWTEWNNDYCGSLNNRCGIKYKKYMINKIEVSDENGDGRPCPYKDGIIKYRYCQGDSNMERCGTDENICECKLDDDKSMILDGENVYDILDGCDFKVNQDCKCPPGYEQDLTVEGDICKLVPGTDCSLNDSGCIYTPASDPLCISSSGTNSHCSLQGTTCTPTATAPPNTTCMYIPEVEEECSIPTFMNDEIERRFYSRYNDNKGKCFLKSCICENGQPVDSFKCDYPGQEKCELTPCDDGYVLEGYPLKCVPYVGTSGTGKCSCPYGIGKIDDSCRGGATKERARIKCEENSCDSLRTEFIDREERYSRGQSGSPYKEFNLEYGKFCKLKADTCSFSTIDSLNIEHKNNNVRFIELNEMYLGSLINLANELQIQQEIINTNLNSNNPKLQLINIIMEKEMEDDESSISSPPCLINGTVTDCYTSFKCKEGHTFVPHTEHINDNNLSIVTCNTQNQPIFNGTCVPVSCPVTNEIKELYDIPYNTCSSTANNCNLYNLNCTSPEYEISSGIRSANCIAPPKSLLSDVESIPLQVSGCEAVEGTEISDTGATSGSDNVEEDVDEEVLQTLRDQNEALTAEIASLRAAR